MAALKLAPQLMKVVTVALVMMAMTPVASFCHSSQRLSKPVVGATYTLRNSLGSGL